MNQPPTSNRILVVDDDPFQTRSIRTAIEFTGRFCVREENRGSAAVETARAFSPHLILLDLNMPEMNGCEVAAALRRDPQLAAVPVAFLSGLVSEDDQGGNICFIAKPVHRQKLIESVTELIASGRATK